MKHLATLGLAASMLCSGAWAADSLLMSVNMGDNEAINNYDAQQNYQTLANYLTKAIGGQVKLVVGQNATTELQATRTGRYAILIAPAHVIGSALKYGYDPVAKVPGMTRTVFVAAKASGLTRLDQAKGKRLALPTEDSLATYLAKGELNAAGLHLKRFFQSVKYNSYQDSALFAMGIGQADLAAVDESVARKWLQTNPGTIISESQPVPAVSVAVNDKIPPAQREKIKVALLQMKNTQAPLQQQMRLAGFEPAERKDYEYVSTLGYFTPKVLAGATVINAQQAKELMDKGVPNYDTRVAHEYTEGHIKGAISLPYKENSAKEVDFDVSLDAWDVGKLPKDKNAPMIFSCNGPECWKSYKSARVAIDHKYARVYWFRGGYPEWKTAGFPVE